MRELSKIPRVNLLGIGVFKITMNDVLDLCGQKITQRESLLLGVVNVAKLVNSRKNRQLKISIEEADVVLADGLGVVWLSRLMGDPLPERVAGIDIMYRLLERASRKKYSVYFLGARKEVVHKVVKYAKERYAGLYVAGFRDGYFDEKNGEIVAEEIRRSQADILFVAMTSPKKENFLSKWREHMDIPVCHGVGGSFDVVAGVVKRAPLWMQSFGLEWFFRVLQEPRRMWKRYLVTNSIFVMLGIAAVVRARLDKLLKACR